MRIIHEGYVCDGYDVRCELDDGTRRTFHFKKQQDNLLQIIQDLLDFEDSLISEFNILGDTDA